MVTLKAAIFDMDGVLIDSEPMWQEAEMIAFGRVGVHLTHEMCRETIGLRVDEVVRIRHKQYGWNHKSEQQVQDDILNELKQLIEARGEAMVGVYQALDLLEASGLRLALASSTHLHLIKTVLKKLKIGDRFEVIHSAEFEPLGKPHPGIYLTTLKKLGVSPDEAFAFEDSLTGVIAAKAARLQTVAIPDANGRVDSRFNIADLKLNSLAEFTQQKLKQLCAAAAG